MTLRLQLTTPVSGPQVRFSIEDSGFRIWNKEYRTADAHATGWHENHENNPSPAVPRTSGTLSQARGLFYKPLPSPQGRGWRSREAGEPDEGFFKAGSQTANGDHSTFALCRLPFEIVFWTEFRVRQPLKAYSWGLRQPTGVRFFTPSQLMGRAGKSEPVNGIGLFAGLSRFRRFPRKPGLLPPQSS
jgi:hypothetical protein